MLLLQFIHLLLAWLLLLCCLCYLCSYHSCSWWMLSANICITSMAAFTISSILAHLPRRVTLFMTALVTQCVVLHLVQKSQLLWWPLALRYQAIFSYCGIWCEKSLSQSHFVNSYINSLDFVQSLEDCKLASPFQNMDYSGFFHSLALVVFLRLEWPSFVSVHKSTTHTF